MAVVGTDGIAPIYKPDDTWKMWSLDEIWQGLDSVGRNRYVPKVKDYVIKPETFETWIVDALDAVSLKPTLRIIRPNGMSYDLTQEDVLFGVGPGPDAETYRAYLNTTVFPHTLCVDTRLKIHGTMSSYAKIFLGSNTGSSGEVISKIYDASGNFISENVPLELAALDSHINYSVKVLRRCNVTKKLPNNERITVVVYADDGHVVSRRQLLVEVTDTIQDLNQPMKYISDISLECIWLSKTNVNQINYPLNIPMDALNMIGVVHYSDGSTLKMPVDGGKFSMLGLEGRLASIPDLPHRLVLRYVMAREETAYAPTGVNGRYITKPYTIMTTNPNDSIAVKLYGYPIWTGEATGYQMNWWLLNVARNVYFNVTPFVRFSSNTGPYNPLLYGYLQRKSVSINLRDVSGSFIPFNHTQVVDIVLNRPPTNDVSPDWIIGTEGGDTFPRFGDGVYGLKKGSLVNFKGAFATYEDWLTAYYQNTSPLVNTVSENEAPKPTHFFVTYGTTETEWEVADWNKDLNIGPVTTPSSAALRFICRTAQGDLQLSYAVAPIKSPA